MKHISFILLLIFSYSISYAEKIRHQSATLLTEFLYSYEDSARSVPVKIYYPKDVSVKNIPVIIMSHGLGGSREIGAYLGVAWSRNGFVVVAMQHEGSDRNIIKDKRRSEYVKSLRRAISVTSFLKRVHDVKATIDQLAKWNSETAHPLFGKVNLDQIGMCGHSFGAVTTQATSGQWNAMSQNKFNDERIKAAFAMSPSIPKKMRKPDLEAAKKAFSKVSIPWLLMTGTKDKAIITPNVTVESRKQVYENLPPGDKYQLVLEGATHMAFSDRTLFGAAHRNPSHHKAIETISTAFFKAYLKDDADAKAWLRSDEVKKVLSFDDSWMKK